MTALKDYDKARAFYNSAYYSREFALKNTSWHDRLIASRLGDLEGHEVLDVACGGGMWLKLLAERGAGIAGVDIADRAIEYCRETLPQGEFHVGAAEALPYESDRFTIVTCMGSLEHFADKPQAIREMIRVAKVGSRFLILVPNAGFATRRMGLFRGTLQTAIREDVYTLAEWEAIFLEGGLEVMDRWRDLHVLSRNWICQKSPLLWPLRAAQAVALAVWPVSWQYQVYHLCTTASR